MMKKLFPVELLWSSCLEMPSDLEVAVVASSLLLIPLAAPGCLLLNTVHHQPRRLLGAFYPQIKVQEKLWF